MNFLVKAHHRFNDWLDSPGGRIEHYLMVSLLIDPGGVAKPIMLYLGVLSFAFLFESLVLGMIIVGLIELHEQGHATAMRWYGLKNISTSIIPFIGGFAKAEGFAELTPERRWFIAAAGPLTGILPALIFLALLTEIISPSILADSPDAIKNSAIAILVLSCGLNAFNLLPIYPLDGGRMLLTLFEDTPKKVQAIVVAVSILPGLTTALLLKDWVLGLIILILGTTAGSASIGGGITGHSKTIPAWWRITAVMLHLAIFAITIAPLALIYLYI